VIGKKNSSESKSLGYVKHRHKHKKDHTIIADNNNNNQSMQKENSMRHQKDTRQRAT
jgi:hypothetical protein